MTTTVAPSPAHVEVEDAGRILRGLLIPYGEPSVCASRDRNGALLIYSETFDHKSIPELPVDLTPLLLSHDESRPVGRVLRWWHTPDGLNIEAELVGSDPELDGIRRRADAGVMASLSVGFMSDQRSDEWTAPSSPGGLPAVRRRQVVIREASICTWPAYKSAVVRGIHQRTRAQQRQHEQSEQILATHSAATVLEVIEPPPPPPPPAPRPDEVFEIDGYEYRLPPLPQSPGPDATPAQHRQYELARDAWTSRAQHVDFMVERRRRETFSVR